MSEAHWTVAGLPPVKNEAKSLLSAGHAHTDRVVALLSAARSVVDSGRWEPTAGVSLALELVVLAPIEPPADATNYLGGVGDVLEDKSHRGELAHLGDLASVSLYENDRRIHEVHYRWQLHEDTYYEVRLWTR